MITEPLAIFDPLLWFAIILATGCAIHTAWVVIGKAFDYIDIRNARMLAEARNALLPAYDKLKAEDETPTVVIPRLAAPPKTIGFDIYI